MPNYRSFNAGDALDSSDHSPVSASFFVGVGPTSGRGGVRDHVNRLTGFSGTPLAMVDGPDLSGAAALDDGSGEEGEDGDALAPLPPRARPVHGDSAERRAEMLNSRARRLTVRAGALVGARPASMVLRTRIRVTNVRVVCGERELKPEVAHYVFPAPFEDSDEGPLCSEERGDVSCDLVWIGTRPLDKLHLLVRVRAVPCDVM